MNEEKHEKLYELAFQTDCGLVRENNEDHVGGLVLPYGYLAIVCDGMGGHNKGEYASKLAIEVINSAFEKKKTVSTLFSGKHLVMCSLKKANRKINMIASKNEKCVDMGTTVVLALRLKHETIIANIGDSRAYILAKGKLKQVTTDQSYVEYLYQNGKITRDEMKSHPKKHVLMNALGINPSISVDLNSIPNLYDKLILMSDGLYNMLEDYQIANTLKRDDLTTEEKCQQLINQANGAGGKDNIGIVIMEESK